MSNNISLWKSVSRVEWLRILWNTQHPARDTVLKQSVLLFCGNRCSFIVPYKCYGAYSGMYMFCLNKKHSTWIFSSSSFFNLLVLGSVFSELTISIHVCYLLCHFGQVILTELSRGLQMMSSSSLMTGT